MRKSGSEALIGRVIANKFAIESLLGQGAMGAVYRARQTALEKTVAIKVLHVEHADDAQFAARFHREAKAASKLNHPNSMQVIDFGEEPDGLLYIAMEYLDGRTLHRVIHDDGPLAPERIADIVRQTLAALAVAHEMGIVHRDLKPENIMVLSGMDDDGRPKDVVKVCDFGIAKMTDSRHYKREGDRESNAPVTTAGFLIGTPEYMSPEQGRGEKLDARSDLYSMGVILYQCLAGRVPFEAENAIGVVLKHITEDPVPPSTLAARCHKGLEAVCLRALAKPREKRFESAREMRTALRAAIDGRVRDPEPSRPSVDDRASVKLVAADGAPASESAETVAIAAPATTGAAGAHEKATLTGAEIPGVPSRRRTLMVGVVAALSIAAALAVIVAVTTGRLGGANDRAASLDSTGAPARARAIPPPSGAPTDEPSKDDPRAASTQRPKSAPPHANAFPLASAHVAAWPSSQIATSASAALASAAPLVSASAPPASASPPPAPPAPPAASSAAPPDATPAADFDVSRAYVVIGFVTAQGVREPAVRAAVRSAGLASCYKAALKSRGARAEGYSTLTLSIDETGRVRGAVYDASFLPAMARCIQGAASAIAVPKSQVDSGGATATVNLSFKAP